METSVKEKIIKDNIYGSKFRKMRVAHHINLVDAAKGITNKSTLAEWEKGKDNLSWCALLFNIHIQPIEFLEDTVSSHLYFSIQDIANAYGTNDIEQLKVISLKYLKQSQNEPLNKDLLLKAAMACNFYEDLTGKDIFPSLASEKLVMYFSDVVNNDNCWYYENIFYFNSVTQLLSPTHLYGFSLKLLEYVKKEKIDSKIWYDLSLNALLNTVFSLIKKDLQKAENLLEKLDTLEIMDLYAEETIREKFMNSLICYAKNIDSTEMINLFKYLDFLGLKKMKSDFQVAFTQIAEIYDR